MNIFLLTIVNSLLLNIAEHENLSSIVDVFILLAEKL